MTVIITRPEVRNAVDPATASALTQAFEKLEKTDSLAVAVLAGADGNFCAGFDLKALASESTSRLSETGDGPMGPTRMQLSKPVIAAIEGYAVAGGLELALWCDLRVAASNATLGVFNRRFGVPLIDMGTIRLPRLIGQGRALDLILTGRPVPAMEALQIGLVDRLVAPGRTLDEAQTLAGQIAGLPQGALRADRHSVLTQWSLSLDEAARAEHLGGVQVLESGEAQQGARRFVEGVGRHGE
ncbi:MAG TPA: crotonase/enoyl-CoA hydratase family protein [Candidatus Acidoferrum sp.]|jgi:enoyl-CoA hydratase|nr:crotonase/enoyl-CoA hydratase family protein [Candidatus Angelobacter sp.]HXD80790.1 crotonase/enoyl-CoA hydratase family protein [Candidatus Acidoferrum sp.]